MKTVAYAFNIVACVFMGFMIFPLAWLIPLTIMSKKVANGSGANSVALGVCTLLFSNLISGILLLVAGDN